MDVDAFWDLIERSGRESATRQERLAWLEGELSRRSAEEIVGFKAWWESVRSRLCTWDLYAVYCSALGWGSLDGFEYFANWIVSLGREPYEQVAECPDTAIELPQLLRLFEVRHRQIAEKKPPVWSVEEEPKFELLDYVTFGPYESATGLDAGSLGEAVHARGVRRRFPLVGADFGGEAWDLDDPAEMARRLPRVARHLGIP
ncbi:DUF4240 domain-containing protein [Planomonospora venezuelensis]|uniref:DUF4240 domain-containing protein n=1 Tax=Planomonospora venezuelensis TaxID=1999 RepID=A0A841D415_PLAVE|nr:DUF4240 domain-containing protein [Planomonospora venezuelensis]MBB5963128.1 hypothetical protein [Planomonospora venezuelensis]GIN00003.1 hypothetical protein Pve01_16610 [Planomonospora venezuelensis]